MSGFKTVLSNSKSVVGAVTDLELELLYNLAGRGPGEGQIVEIGSFQGKSTIFLASGSKKAHREKVWAIDPHQGAYVMGRRFSGPTYKKFLDNLRRARVKDQVVVIRKFSDQAIKTWKKPIRLLFIDGNHSYAGVRKDILGWEPFLVAGGVIALHDALNPAVGPARAIVKLLLKDKRFSNLGVIDSIFYAIKRPARNWPEQINWWFFAKMMQLVSRWLRLKKRKFMRQYIVKRWLKRLLTRVTLATSAKLLFNHEN